MLLRVWWAIPQGKKSGPSCASNKDGCGCRGAQRGTCRITPGSGPQHAVVAVPVCSGPVAANAQPSAARARARAHAHLTHPRGSTAMREEAEAGRGGKATQGRSGRGRAEGIRVPMGARMGCG